MHLKGLLSGALLAALSVTLHAAAVTPAGNQSTPCGAKGRSDELKAAIREMSAHGRTLHRRGGANATTGYSSENITIDTYINVVARSNKSEEYLLVRRHHPSIDTCTECSSYQWFRLG